MPKYVAGEPGSESVDRVFVDGAEVRHVLEVDTDMGRVTYLPKKDGKFRTAGGNMLLRIILGTVTVEFAE